MCPGLQPGCRIARKQVRFRVLCACTCRDRISDAIYSSTAFDQLVIEFGSRLLSQNCQKIPAGENGAAGNCPVVFYLLDELLSRFTSPLIFVV